MATAVVAPAVPRHEQTSSLSLCEDRSRQEGKDDYDKSLDDIGLSSPPERDLEKCDNTFSPPVPINVLDKERSDLVEFDGPNDPGNPKNWSKGKKWAITVSMSTIVFTVTFASTVYSVAIGVVAEKFHVAPVVSTLGVSLFVLGFVFGPILFGPASEVFGRRIPMFAGYLVFAIFQIPVAVARNIETIMLGRFLGGFFAAAPISIVGGALADIWDPIERAYAICVFAAGGFAGPVAGPMVGGFVTQSYLGWRWTAWITLIMAALFGSIGWFVIPETSAAKILQNRAKHLRYETRNWALHAKADENRINVNTIMSIYLVRPFKMFVQEPILALVTAYMSFIYGILYLLFEAYPISFHEQRGWNLGVASLPFTAFVVGIVMGASLIAYSTATNFKRAFIKHGRCIPEERLPPMIVGAIVLPIGLFLFAWTSNPHITWVPSVLATALIGMGSLVTFWQGMSYLIDCYGFYSNSAIAANTFIRSIAGAGFPLFTPAMYHKLGVPWAMSLLGFLCVVFAPVPMLFYVYGAKIRERSRFTPAG
ncbi:MFS transporter [Lepidopterella palustris CBS 459.81]|uniref:MFS transporter n=1 Tax=Lepidopterella palustris CBS 459.81 TaxID=1314670 RepID=A0A8E2EFU3_9PEZI|nr:MFS transporter [Lepidopterella palustris CBS 459.81]